MRHYQKVYYGGCEWIFIEQIGEKYLLRSVNKNISDILVHPQDVKSFEEMKS